MTAKLIGAVMIEAACAFMGFYASDRLGKRKKYLGNIISAMSVLETEISFGANRLKRAFEAVDAMIDTRGLFSAAAERLEKEGVRRAWAGAVSEKKAELRLDAGDAEVLEMFGGRLGMTDTDEQIKNIAHVKSLLAEREKAAADEYAKSGRLYRSGGVLGGMFLILMLL